MAKASDWGRFSRLDTEASDTSIIATSQGVAGSGKSHFWLTAPGPIAYFLFDPGGLKGLRNNPLFGEKEIMVRDYCGDLNIGKLPEDERVSRSVDIMAQFQEDWDTAVRLARTLVVDKETMLWEMLRYAHDEVKSPVPKNFQDLNLMYRGWIQDAEVKERNLGFIRDVKDTWGKIGVNREGKPQLGFTGRMVPEGQKYLTGNVQINLSHRWDDDEREFCVTILEKCRLGTPKKLMGREFPDLDFPTLGLMLYPKSDPETWS